MQQNPVCDILRVETHGKLIMCSMRDTEWGKSINVHDRTERGGEIRQDNDREY